MLHGVRTELRLKPQQGRWPNHIRSGLHAFTALSGRCVCPDVIMGELLPTLPIFRVPSRGRQTVFWKKLPLRSFGELEAILDGIFEEAIKAAGRRRRLSPHEILAEQEALLPQPEDQLELQCSTFVTPAL